jgi:hypothetical protein
MASTDCKEGKCLDDQNKVTKPMGPAGSGSGSGSGDKTPSPSWQLPDLTKIDPNTAIWGVVALAIGAIVLSR